MSALADIAGFGGFSLFMKLKNWSFLIYFFDLNWDIILSRFYLVNKKSNNWSKKVLQGQICMAIL